MRYSILAAVVLAISSFSEAYAHAELESSIPKDGQVLASAPDAVTITFSEALRKNESDIRVFDADKNLIKGKIITKNGNEETLSETLPKLDSGVYTVKWKAVCLCTDHHATHGSFNFTVK
jgi:copper transport protein